jgi:hypothetical protein
MKQGGLIVAVFLVLVMGTFFGRHYETKQSMPVAVSSACVQARNVLELNRNGLVQTAVESRQDIAIFLERNRWITDSLEREMQTVCR